MLVFIALFIVPIFVKSTTQDCLAFVSYYRIRTETICLPTTGFCQNVFWGSDDRKFPYDFQISNTSIPVTCGEARQTVLDNRDKWIRDLLSRLFIRLKKDLIQMSLEFPVVDQSTTYDWGPMARLHNETRLAVSYFDNSSWPLFLNTCLDNPSFINNWGLAVKVMIGSVHSGGGIRRLSPEKILFVKQNRDMFTSFQQLFYGEGVDLLGSSSRRIQFEEGTPLYPDAVDLDIDRLARLRQQIEFRLIREEDFVVSYDEIEPLVVLLEDLPADRRIEEVCRHMIPRILARLKELDLSELVIRIGHKCKSSSLTIEARKFIAEDVLFSLNRRGVRMHDVDPFVLLIDQTLDDRKFFLQSEMMLMEYDKIHFIKKDLCVRFLDSGSYGDGVLREWFTRIFRYIASPESGFFQYTDDRRILLKFVDAIPPGWDTVRWIESYRFIGRVIGLAWKHGITIGVPLSYSTVARITSPRDEWFLLEMLQHDDPVAAKAFSNPAHFTASGDIPFFEEDEDDVDHSIMVDELNVMLYMYRRLDWLTGGSKTHHTSRIIVGLHDILPYTYLSFYSIQEIADRLRGPLVIDLDQLYESTSYFVADGIDNRTAETIKEWIWASLRSFNQEEMQDFLEFVSGSRYPPIHGFANASFGGDHWLQIRIENSFESRNPLPMSRTCFKAIYFGLYDSEDLLKQRLVTAMIFAKEILLE